MPIQHLTHNDGHAAWCDERIYCATSLSLLGELLPGSDLCPDCRRTAIAVHGERVIPKLPAPSKKELVDRQSRVDLELAEALIPRLNSLLTDPRVRADIDRLIETRIPVSTSTADHPSIQVTDDKLGFLGLLNGLTGTIPSGPKEGWGYIAAVYSEAGELTRFELSTDPSIKPEHLTGDPP